MEIIPVVAACIIENNKVLMQSREGESKLENYFQFPGGKVEAREQPLGALERELMEEIGVMPFNVQLVHSQTNRYEEWQDYNSYLMLFYSATLREIPQSLVHPIHWIPIHQIPKVKHLPGTIEALNAMGVLQRDGV